MGKDGQELKNLNLQLLTHNCDGDAQPNNNSLLF